jgi:TfoX/Sxy family transcriptional regulator of competence genes
MAYDADLAERIRALLALESAVSEKPMFGGLAFLVDGKMAAAASRSGGLMVRVDPADTDALVIRRHVERFEMRGRPLDGWLAVAAPAVTSDAELQAWVQRGIAYARNLSTRSASTR